jgi:hypothetical protein
MVSKTVSIDNRIIGHEWLIDYASNYYFKMQEQKLIELQKK